MKRTPLSNVCELHVEVSDSCNLHCDYCYFIAKEKVKSSFSLQDFERIIKAFFQKTSCDVTFVFHGGEPLMCSPEWIDKACRITHDCAKANGHMVCFHLQTNGTLLTDKHIDVLSHHHFTVNVSLDGPAEIHDSVRGGYKQTIKAIELLRKAGLLIGTISVIGKHNYNQVHHIVEHLLALGVSRYHFNIGSILNGNKNLILSENEILTYLQDSYHEFARTYQSACNWVLLGKLRRFVSKEIPQLSCDSPICGAAIHKIHVKSNGNFYPCGSCVSKQEGIRTFLLGNILDDNLSQEEYEKRMSAFHHLYFAHREVCMNCKAQTVCDFLCPAFDEFDSETITNKCKAYNAFIDFLEKQDLAEIQSIIDFYKDEND
jgi:uncharacterized protein